MLHNILHNNRYSRWKPQEARYVALRVIKAQRESKDPPQPVLELLDRYLKRLTPIVLLGEPGAGKTTVLEALTYRLSSRALRYNRLIWLTLLVGTGVLAHSAPIFVFIWLASYVIWEPLARRFPVPLFIEARSDYSGGNIREWCESTCKGFLGAKPIIGSRRRVALLLDGMNEVQVTLFGGFLEGWRAHLRDDPHCRVIFTSRGGEESPAHRLAVEPVLNICDLDDNGVQEFLKVYGNEKDAKQRKPRDLGKSKRGFEELRNKSLLGKGSIGRNPYWLKMIVESGLYTVNRGTLFRSFAEKLLRRETEEKPEERKHKPEWKIVPVEVEMAALGALALAMHREKRIGFTGESGWSKARAVIRESLGDLPYAAEDVLGEAQASTLLRVHFRARVEFVHQLVQEFFAAYALRVESKWREALPQFGDVWWWQTLFHLAGLVRGEGTAESYGDFVCHVMGDGSNEQRVLAAIGLLRCVESSPIHLSSAVTETFGRLMEGNLTLRVGATTLDLRGDQQQAILELVRALGEEATQAFAILLKDPRLAFHIIGVLILSIIGTTRAAELILAYFDDRSYAFVEVRPLVRLGEPAVEPLISALRDKAGNLREFATEALIRIGTPAIQPLIGVLRDRGGNIRKLALEALVQIGEASVLPLINALDDRVLDGRRSAITALARIGDARAIEPFISLLGDDVYGCDVAAALHQLGPRAVEPLIGALRSRERNARLRAIEILGLIGDVPAVDPLLAGLRDGRKGLHRSTAEALGRIGDGRAVGPLIAVLRNNEVAVRRSAARALGLIGDPRAVAPLLDALRDRTPNVRRVAVEALVKIGAPSVSALIAALQDYDLAVRSCAALALGRIEDVQAVEPLIAALRDDEIRGVVVDALGRIAGRRSLHELETVLQLDRREVVLGNLAYSSSDALRRIRQRQRREETD